MTKKFIVVIPARYASSRLPGKPLINIAGLPMIIRTCKQCLKAVSVKDLYVATDDKRIQKTCKNYGIKAILTSKKCLTGTDRVAETAKKIVAENYINVQGDEPLFNPLDLKKIIKKTLTNKNKVLLGYTKISNKSSFYNKNTPKVVFDKYKNLLYASREPIPFNKQKNSLNSFRQVLTYFFPREILLKFSKSKRKSYFEKLEDIEILRFLEIGIKVNLIKMSNKSQPVDTRKDLEFVKKKISKNK